MFQALIKPKLHRMEEAVVLNLCKTTELRKQALQLKINMILKNFEKKF